MADPNASSNGGQLPPGTVGQGAIVITGASTGIGAACALRMDQRGYRVFAGVRRQEDGERLRSMASDRLTPLMIDVTNQRSIDDAAAAVDVATGDHGVAGLVNNAGVAVTGPVEYLSVDRYREQFEVNYFGQIAVTQAFLPAIRRAGGRHRDHGLDRRARQRTLPLALCRHEARLGGADRLAAWRARSVGHSMSPSSSRGRSRRRSGTRASERADEVMAEMPEEAISRYEPFIEPVKDYARDANESGSEVSKVADAVEHRADGEAAEDALPRRHGRPHPGDREEVAARSPRGPPDAITARVAEVAYPATDALTSSLPAREEHHRYLCK